MEYWSDGIACQSTFPVTPSFQHSITPRVNLNLFVQLGGMPFLGIRVVIPTGPLCRRVGRVLNTSSAGNAENSGFPGAISGSINRRDTRRGLTPPSRRGSGPIFTPNRLKPVDTKKVPQDSRLPGVVAGE